MHGPININILCLTRMCLKIYVWKLWWVNLKERESIDDLGVGGGIILTVKLKWSRYSPGVAQRVSRVIALLFHDHGTGRGLAVSSTPRPHFIPGKDTLSILQEGGWDPGSVWTGGKSRPHRDLIPEHPARIQSLYRLSYPEPLWFFKTEQKSQANYFNIYVCLQCIAILGLKEWNIFVFCAVR